jgi:hypothetical protein
VVLKESQRGVGAVELRVRARARDVWYALDVPVDGRAVEEHDESGDGGGVDGVDGIAREGRVVVDDELASRRSVIAVVNAEKEP